MDTQEKATKSLNSKLAISKSSSSSTKSDGAITSSMSKKLKESSQISPLAKYVEKNLRSPSYVSNGDADKSLPSSPRSLSSYSFTTNVAPIVVTNATTIEEQLASLTKAINGLTKHVQEQDVEIARLINKEDNVDANHVMGKQVENHDDVEAPAKQHYTEKDKYAKELQISSDGFILVDQLKNLLNEPSEMPIGYQPPKFPQFDVKKFVQSLKGNAFDWYTDFEAGSIDIEMSMITSRVEGPPMQEFRRTKEKQEVKKGGKPFSKALSKESMAVNIAPFKLKSTAKDNIA
ncbi:UNVERIFIED_CONTAM: hypothetical protein Sangu_2610100 [Sesamum angustifolium]|uniref:Ty3-gypsy retrotransposon protein n=1 Tax=Sesamum angustifolium TaxID=2727405 RepID=A0AAW2J7M4_9LAMI